MKSGKWFFFAVVLLCAVSLGSCPPQPQRTPVFTPAPVPTTEAQVAAVATPAEPLRMTVIEHEVPLVQPSIPEEITTARTIADFEFETNGDVDLFSISGVVISNDDGEAGVLKLFFGEIMVGYEDMTKMDDGHFTFGSTLLLSAGKNRFRIVAESTHDYGDTLQIELRSIKTSLPDMNTVIRWPAVSCGP